MTNGALGVQTSRIERIFIAPYACGSTVNTDEQKTTN